MADKTANLVQLFSQTGTGMGERAVLYGVKDIDTSDTVDVEADFSKVKSAQAIAAGNPASLLDTPGAVGTVLAFDTAAWTDEFVYLLVVGNSP